MDVAMQVKEMLEKAELEVQEALEQGQDGDSQGGEEMMERVDGDDDEVEQVSGGRCQVARINDESEEEDEDEE
jgi:hypothetical protein